jgi:hypothetical protein
MSPNWRLAGGQGDAGVDRHRGGAHPALGAVEAHEPAEGGLLRLLLANPPAIRSGQQGLDARDELERMERLDDVVIGAGAEALDPLFDVGLGGEHDDRHAPDPAFGLADPLGGGVSVQLRHRHVHEDEVGLHAGRHLHPGLAVRGDVHLEPLLLEGEEEDALDVQVVVDDQDLGGSHAAIPGAISGLRPIIGLAGGASMHQWSP